MKTKASAKVDHAIATQSGTRSLAVQTATEGFEIFFTWNRDVRLTRVRGNEGDEEEEEHEEQRLQEVLQQE